MRTLASGVFAALVAATPLAALADFSYTLQVPVTVTNVPAGSTIQVTCMLYLPNTTFQTSASSQIVRTTNGAYSGTVTVTTQLMHTRPQMYACGLTVNTTSAQSINGSINVRAPGAMASPAPGWTGTMLTQGVIP
jgi:hypothetical protein